MIQKALRYTRCVQIPKKNTVVVINNNSSFYFNKDHISDFKRSLIKSYMYGQPSYRPNSPREPL